MCRKITKDIINFVCTDEQPFILNTRIIYMLADPVVLVMACNSRPPTGHLSMLVVFLHRISFVGSPFT